MVVCLAQRDNQAVNEKPQITLFAPRFQKSEITMKIQRGQVLRKMEADLLADWVRWRRDGRNR
jgi:FixJ family two-component response regulator